MSRLLVVQPDSAQADALRSALNAHVSQDVIVAESLDDALSLIDERIPDVILLPTLTAGAVENYLIAYVGTIPGAGHVQILGLPFLEHAAHALQPRARRLFPWRQPREALTSDCDPRIFTNDVVTYLASARALKEQAELESALERLRRRSERRREPRFANSEVPWISFARFGRERAALINVSSRGALLRIPTRPEHHFLKRSDSNVQERPRLILEVASDREIHVIGRIIRCVPLRTRTPMQYEVAFCFDDSLALHLPAAGALVPASSPADSNRL